MDVFISFSTKDEKIAREISEILSENGISSWMCKKNIYGGSRWAAEITEALSDCKLFLLVVSKNSIASEQVPKEVNMALNQRKRIIPFRIDNAPLEGELCYHLSNIHYIEPGFGHNKYDTLIGTVRNCLNMPAVQNNSTNITNNISLKNIICFPKINFDLVWIIRIILILILIAAIFGVSSAIKSSKNNNTAVQNEIPIANEVTLANEITTAEEQTALPISSDTNAAAFAPSDISPYEVPNNPNSLHTYDGTGDGFKMCGDTFYTGFSINSDENNPLSFNISGRNFTKLHFKAGHVDGSGHDTQYILIYADDEEIFRREIGWDTLPEDCDIDISGAKKLKFEVRSADYGAWVGITDIIFYDSAQYTPEINRTVQRQEVLSSPKDILPFEFGTNCNGYRVFNDSLKQDDFFKMGGKEYTSGYTASGKCDGQFLFNVADMGFTNLSFVSGVNDSADSTTQYFTVFADGEEIYSKETAPGDLPSANDIDITGAKIIKIVFASPDAGLGVFDGMCLTDVIFYDKAAYTPAASKEASTITHLNSPKELMPYKKDSTTIYNDSLKKDDYFSMGGEKYTSGYKINVKNDAKVYFNISDKGFTNMHFLSGIVDGSDNIVTYVIVYADNEEIFRKEINPGDLPEADDIDITGAKSVMINIQCGDAGLGVMGDAGITDLVFYNKNEYTP